MRLLLFILLAGCLALSGCASAPLRTPPHRATVAKVAHVALSGSSFETGLPETDPATVSLAKGYLDASAVSKWMGIPPSQALSNKGVGQAIEGAIPPNTTRDWQVRLLYEAEALLPNAK